MDERIPLSIAGRPGTSPAWTVQISAPPQEKMAWIPGGPFLMGSDHHYPEEGPAHPVTVDGFWMDQYAVTNNQFRRFVAETGYVTVAERPPDPADYPDAPPAMLRPGSLVFQKPMHHVDRRDWQQWWAYMPGADWRHPEGPRTSTSGRGTHPVVHIAFPDAEAYALWAGKMLPTEAEWECAARGGLEGAVYTWGDAYDPRSKALANTWQGEFPWQNLLHDRYERTARVGSYPPNGYGLSDMAGNVWEWTTDWYQERHPATPAKACCIPVNPRGGPMERSFDPYQPKIAIPRKVLKGGSFLCAPNYCLRYRPAARIAEAIDSSTCHLGFRCMIRPGTPS